MKLIIYGCAEQPIKIVSRLRRIAKQDIEILGFLDTDRTKWKTNYWGYPVFGGLEKVKDFKSKAKFCNCVSRTSEQRKQITDGILENGGELMSLIDPEIDLEFVKVGNGVYIQEGIYLQAGVEIGDNVTIHMGTMVAHGTKIEKHAMLTFACNVTGGFVGEGAAIYTGANIAAKIGKWSVIGAGSVVVNEIPEYSLAYGNPAKVIRKLERGHQVH